MSSQIQDPSTRIIVYIDGFNFYFGLRESKWQCYYWLDFPRLAANLIRDVKNSKLVGTKYFSSRISAPEDKRQRQNNYFEVLALQGSIEFRFGNYRDTSFECSGCRRPNWTQNEKQTDVNIAVELMIDAFENRFDMAVLVSGDSDLVPPIREIKRLFPEKKIMACFPPKRRSKEIRKASSGEIVISEIDLKNNQLPPVVTRADGFEYKCPDTWR